MLSKKDFREPERVRQKVEVLAEPRRLRALPLGRLAQRARAARLASSLLSSLANHEERAAAVDKPCLAANGVLDQVHEQSWSKSAAEALDNGPNDGQNCQGRRIAQPCLA